ncbi:hypothetical protein NEOLEDRAFT_1177659 [Neolentinus lepideus HHB14362 ss-1]|uniref:Uncharacterized protein n=1 Tax=Neolentinus lepideus HHB14362 ss-1 TaxID=1314782 RepID=A0A165T754_9AGAM|nr:hypothetical protein NEOLEDRAFT_1177659 [Neolentinus lepideus HHB14362 ss-1]
MLPSRPNNASKVGAGLRSAPRSRSVGRPSHEYEREQLRTQAPPSSVRTLRPQRSAANLPSHSDRGRDATSRRMAPPVPSNPRARSQAPSDRRRERYHDDQASYSYKSGTESISSRSSVSSSGSSFLDRMKGRSGYASSRTSLEEDADSYSPKQGRQFDGRQAVRRDVANDGSEDEQQSDYGFQQTGFGSSLWSRVAGAAGSLTVNVSKAWAANITTFNGEETPPGQESRLTRAMKAYHLEKARDPSDLPGWLFSEQERRSRPSRHESPLDRQLYEEVDTTVPPRSRGLKDIYAAAATSTLSGYGDRSEASSGRRFAGQAQQPPSSKATDRLKAMRDAKRGAMARHDADDGHLPVSSFGQEGYGHRMEEERRSPRMGLPSGPGLRSRRG